MQHSGASVVRVLLIISLAVGVVVLCLIALPEVWIYRETRGFRPGSRPAVRAVLKAYLRSRITGSGYWDDEMIEQARFMRQRPLAERLDFYRAMVLLGDLDTYRAVLFVETVGAEANALSENLRDFKASSEFGKLCRGAQRNVEVWMNEMKMINREYYSNGGQGPR